MGYSTYYSSYSSNGPGTFLAVLVILLLVIAAANICATYVLVKTAKEKGHYCNDSWILWFIGLCGSMFMLAFIVLALPDHSTTTQQSIPSSVNQLPEV